VSFCSADHPVSFPSVIYIGLLWLDGGGGLNDRFFARVFLTTRPAFLCYDFLYPNRAILVLILTTGVGYVRQEPWLQEGTIRDNILFGTVYQHTWYSRVRFLPVALSVQSDDPPTT
jgi:hypothetical protein